MVDIFSFAFTQRCRYFEGYRSSFASSICDFRKLGCSQPSIVSRVGNLYLLPEETVNREKLIFSRPS